MAAEQGFFSRVLSTPLRIIRTAAENHRLREERHVFHLLNEELTPEDRRRHIYKTTLMIGSAGCIFPGNDRDITRMVDEQKRLNGLPTQEIDAEIREHAYLQAINLGLMTPIPQAF